MLNILSRPEARRQGLQFFFTGSVCIRGHLSERLTSTGNCRECVKYKSNQYYLNNTEKAKKAARDWSKSNADQRNQSARLRLKANPQANKLKCGNRRAAKLQATPIFSDPDIIKQIYESCPIGHEVDHIVPLNPSCKTVCGLHVSWNLQHLPAGINSAKKDRWWPDDWSDYETLEEFLDR